MRVPFSVYYALQLCERRGVVLQYTTAPELGNLILKLGLYPTLAQEAVAYILDHDLSAGYAYGFTTTLPKLSEDALHELADVVVSNTAWSVVR